MKFKIWKLITIICFISPVLIKAQSKLDVSFDEAKRVARSLIFQENLSISYFDEIEIEDFLIHQREGKPLLYVINLKPDGFVIVPASKEMEPFLAYSTENKIDLINIPENLKFYLEEKEDEVTFFKTQPQGQIRDNWNLLNVDQFHRENNNYRAFNEVSPLLENMAWGQDKFYNADCPADPSSLNGYDGRVPAGCTATAIGQIMKYWNHPKSGHGTAKLISNKYGEFLVNFEEQIYNWDQISDFLSNYNKDVSNLLFNLGVAFSMSYSPGFSGSTIIKVRNGLVSYLKYNFDMVTVSRSSYQSLDEWYSILDGQLENEIPVYYQGFRTDKAEGHAWVCDGYKTVLNVKLYHMNWGWNGKDNGYYSLNTWINSFGTQVQGNPKDHMVIRNLMPATAIPKNVSASDGKYSDKVLINWENENDGPKGRYCMILRNITDDFYSAMPLNNWSYNLSFFEDKTGVSNTVYYYWVVLAQDATGFNKTISKRYDTGYRSGAPNVICGLTTLTSTSSSFSDGSKENNYLDHTYCTWLIRPDYARFIHLKFISFETEAKHDVVKVFKGQNNTGELIASFSGNAVPDDIIIESSALFIEFITDGSITRKGWNAFYTSSMLPINGQNYDEPCGAVNVPLLPYIRYTYGNNSEATTTLNPEPGFCEGQLAENDIWFKVTFPPGNRLFRLKMDAGTLRDAVFSVYVSSDCLRFILQPDACQDDNAYSLMPDMDLISTNSTDLPFDGYFRVWGADGAKGSFYIRFTDLGEAFYEEEEGYNRTPDPKITLSSVKENFDEKSENRLIYPVPAYDYFQINENMSRHIEQVEIFDAHYRSFSNYNFNGQNYIRFNCSQWPSGIYFVKLKGKEFVKFERIIVE